MTARKIIDEITDMVNTGIIDENAEVEFDFETGTMCEVASVDDICAEDGKLILSGFYKHRLGEEEKR